MMAEQAERSLEKLAAAGRSVAKRQVRQRAESLAEQRVRTLESEIADLKSRVNGLVFVLIGAVATQVIIRLFG